MEENPTGKGLEDILKANEGKTVSGPMLMEHNLVREPLISFQDLHTRILTLTIYLINIYRAPTI